jgi:hypothetical protein
MKKLGEFQSSSLIPVFTCGLDQLYKFFVDRSLLRDDVFRCELISQCVLCQFYSDEIALQSVG